MRDFEYQAWENLATVWAGWGAAPWSEDGTQCTLTEPEMVDAMTWIHDAVVRGRGDARARARPPTSSPVTPR